MEQLKGIYLGLLCPSNSDTTWTWWWCMYVNSSDRRHYSLLPECKYISNSCGNSICILLFPYDKKSNSEFFISQAKCKEYSSKEEKYERKYQRWEICSTFVIIFVQLQFIDRVRKGRRDGKKHPIANVLHCILFTTSNFQKE